MIATPRKRRKGRQRAANNVEAAPLALVPYSAPVATVDAVIALSERVQPDTFNGTDTATATYATELEAICASANALFLETHDIRARNAEERKAANKTGKTYSRHVQRYVEWTNFDQQRRAEQNPGYHPLPPFPVTASKAAAFLHFEMNRPMVRCCS